MTCVASSGTRDGKDILANKGLRRTPLKLPPRSRLVVSKTLILVRDQATTLLEILVQCLVNDEIQELDFAETYKKYEGQEIEMGVEIHERSVVVSFDALHTSLSFACLYDSGLSPAEDNLFCENSYKESKAEVSRLQEINRPGYEEMLKEQRQRNPKSAEVMDRIRAVHPSPPEDKIVKEETRRFRMTKLTESHAQEVVNWGEKKKALYHRVLEVVRDQAKFGCGPGEKVEVTIPDFNLGDPAIYVLMKGPLYDVGHEIEWIDFDCDLSTGEYTAQHVKSFGLPDEIRSLVSMIKKKQITQLKLECPAN